MYLLKRGLTAMLTLCLLSVALIASVQAGNVVLSINGNGTSTWVISGEPSLIMNGFDLRTLNVSTPTRLDRVTLDVESPVPGQLIDVIIYQDTNGGSPSDATVVGRKQVDITQSGVFSTTFDPALEITAPIVWVAFYLPVDFEFRADTSGTSLLTYWAWTPGSRFELNTLSAASVLGPGNGTAPVNIDMGGVAKITAEVITTTGINTATPSTVATGQPSTSSITQQQGGNGNLAALQGYPACEGVSYDRLDIDITYRNDFRVFCTVPQETINATVPQGYIRRSSVYDILRFGGIYATVPLPSGVTHCIRPQPDYISSAVMGFAYGLRRDWEILPTVRFGDLICAELQHSGYLAYFTPG